MLSYLLSFFYSTESTQATTSDPTTPELTTSDSTTSEPSISDPATSVATTSKPDWGRRKDVPCKRSCTHGPAVTMVSDSEFILVTCAREPQSHLQSNVKNPMSRIVLQYSALLDEWKLLKEYPSTLHVNCHAVAHMPSTNQLILSTKRINNAVVDPNITRDDDELKNFEIMCLSWWHFPVMGLTVRAVGGTTLDLDNNVEYRIPAAPATEPQDHHRSIDTRLFDRNFNVETRSNFFPAGVSIRVMHFNSHHKLLWIGGRRGLATFCIRTKRWHAVRDSWMKFALTPIVVTSDDGYVVLVGGHDEMGKPTDTIFVLDMSNTDVLRRCSIKSPWKGYHNVIRTGGGLHDELLVAGWIRTLFSDYSFRSESLPPTCVMQAIKKWTLSDTIHCIRYQNQGHCVEDENQDYQLREHVAIRVNRILDNLI